MIRAVVFDIGGVLEIVDDDRWQDQWMSRWESAPGAIRSSTYLGPTEADFRARIAPFVTDVDAAMADFWDAYCGQLDVAMRDFVASLKPALIVASLSNSGDGARREEQRRYGFEQLFDLMVYSHEVGVEKPDAAIYELTRQRLGVRPDEIVFLDDREGAVEGARVAGWHAVLHVSTPESIATIRALIAHPPQLA